MSRAPGAAGGLGCGESRRLHPGTQPGEEYVGVGVIPQVKVTPRLSDFRAGLDTVLDAAVRLLHEKR